ncbi:hypothetical protein M8J77_007588 [Diaphorina citri]|nr:hypothetical protein M8J77_007588 [Diaphorina citri]
MPPKKNTFRAPIKAQSEAKLGLKSGAKPYEKKDSHSSADSYSHDSKYNNASINGNDSIGYEDNTLNPHPIFKRAKPLDRNETANKTIENGTNDTVTLGNRTAHDDSATQDGRVSQDVGGNTQNDRVKQDDVTEETPMQAMDTQESTMQNMEETVQDTSTQEIFTQESINEVTLTQQSRTDVVTQQSPLQAMDTEESTVQDTFTQQSTMQGAFTQQSEGTITQKSTMQGTFTHARFLCSPLEKETSKVKHETQGDMCLDETAMEEETPVNETEEVKPLNEIGESKLKPLDEIEEAKPLNEADEGMFLKATSTSSNQQDPSSSLRVAKSSQETLSNGIPKSCTKKTKATPAKKIKETPNNNAIQKPTIKRNKETLGKRNETPTKRMKKTPSKAIKEALIKTINGTPSKAIKETPNNGIQESPMPMTPLKVSQLTNPDRVFTPGTSEVTNQDRPSVHEVSTGTPEVNTGTPEVNHENSTDVNEAPRTAEVNRNSSQQALAPSTPTANNCNRSDEELAGTPEPGTPFTPFTNPFTPLTNPFTPIEITPFIHTPSQQTEGAISDTPSRYDTLQSSVLSQDSLPCSQNSLRKNLLMNTRRPEVIKCVLATCPPSLNQKERLLWLQEKRCVGIWAMCNLCTSYRFLPDVYDPCTLPQSGWRCSLYPGKLYM